MATRKETIEVNVTGADKGARDIGKLDNATDRLGDEFRDLARDASKLDRQLEDLRRTQQRLASEFARTGDLGLQKQFAAANRQASALARMQKTLAGAAKAAGPTSGGARAAVGGLSLPVSPQMLAGVGIAGAIAAPAVGAGISAAGLLAGGGLVAGGGIALGAAASKPVQESFKGLGVQIADDATRMALAFEKPLLRVAERTRKEWQDVTDDISRMFEKTATSGGVETFAEGITGLIKETLPGLEQASDTFDDFGEVARQKLPQLGRSLTDMFSAFAQGKEGALDFFGDLIDLVGDTVEGIGNVAYGLSKVYEALDAVRDVSLWGQYTQGVVGFGKVITSTVPPVVTLSETIYDATEHTKLLNDEFDKFFGRAKDSREAARDYQESIDELTKSFQENGKTLDINTEKGRANDEAIQRVIDSIKAQRDAAIAAGGGTAEATAAANAKYQEQLRLLQEQLIKLGATPALIAAIIAQYQKVPADVWTTVHVRADLRELNNISEQMNVRLGRRAAGGPVQAGRPYLVGEEGPEIITPTRGGFVHDAAATRSMMGGSGSALGGGGAMTLQFSGDLNSWLAQAVMQAVRTGQISLKAGGQRVGV
jgi:hypothetical protein